MPEQNPSIPTGDPSIRTACNTRSRYVVVCRCRSVRWVGDCVRKRWWTRWFGKVRVGYVVGACGVGTSVAQLCGIGRCSHLTT